ncbi:hypothetical protein FACS1894211_15480 [Clostridia bacterium]|nr:hypothetical protein FACS1894211_15480 [Clostridia bacterium]
MPVIPYTIEKSVCKRAGGRQYWQYAYEHILVEVSDAVAVFLAEDDKRERRYRWKIKKQMQAANIRTVFSLDEFVRSDDGEERPAADYIEDTVNPENRNPLTILIEKEFTDGLYHLYSLVMPSKQSDVFKLHERGYTTTDMAEMFGIDESSARERLHNAFKKAVELYIVRKNYDILNGLEQFFFKDLHGKISDTKYNRLFAAVFRFFVAYTNPHQINLLKFVIDGEYEREIKKYLEKSNPTPETPP